MEELCRRFFSNEIDESEFERRLGNILAPDETKYARIGESLHKWARKNALQWPPLPGQSEILDANVKKAVRMWELVEKVDDRIQESQVESLNSLAGTIPFKAPIRNMASFYLKASEQIKKEMLEGSQ